LANLFFAVIFCFAGSIGRSDFPGCDGKLLIRGIKEKILLWMRIRWFIPDMEAGLL
jgi:hypothetical protein